MRNNLYGKTLCFDDCNDYGQSDIIIIFIPYNEIELEVKQVMLPREICHKETLINKHKIMREYFTKMQDLRLILTLKLDYLFFKNKFSNFPSKNPQNKLKYPTITPPSPSPLFFE